MVEQVRGRWPGAVEYGVRLTPRPSAGETVTSEDPVRALAYTALVGEPQVGDRVLLNASALLRGLGTGGLAFIVAAPDRLPADPDVSQGHIVKARYTPQQQMFMAVDEQDSPHHAIMTGPLATSGDLQGMPVVVADLHSGLLAARHVLGADIAVVIQGPGNVGTGTPWGYTGVAAGEALNAVGTLGGRGVAALRVSDADDRARHRGISHHSTTAYGRICLVAADVPLPVDPSDFGLLVADQAHAMVRSAQGALRVREVDADGLDAALRAAPVRLSTMGRGLDEDHAAFLYSAAAGRYAARLLES
jgi:hypothetical protein